MTPLTLEEVFEQHFSFVWRCLRGLGVPTADLDDVTQEVFVILHRRFTELDQEVGVRPWLYGILRHVAQNHRRVRQRALKRRGVSDEEPVAPGLDPEQSLAARQAAALVESILAQLEGNRREVFWLVELEGLTVPEVSAALQIPLNTAYSRLRLARSDFRAAAARVTGGAE